MTALMWAASLNSCEVAQLLIERKASVNAKGAVIYPYYCRRNQHTIFDVRYFCKNIQNDSTPLVSASATGSNDTVKLLLKHKADIETRGTVLFNFNLL